MSKQKPVKPTSDTTLPEELDLLFKQIEEKLEQLFPDISAGTTLHKDNDKIDLVFHAGKLFIEEIDDKDNVIAETPISIASHRERFAATSVLTKLFDALMFRQTEEYPDAIKEAKVFLQDIRAFHAFKEAP